MTQHNEQAVAFAPAEKDSGLLREPVASSKGPKNESKPKKRKNQKQDLPVDWNDCGNHNGQTFYMPD